MSYRVAIMYGATLVAAVIESSASSPGKPPYPFQPVVAVSAIVASALAPGPRIPAWVFPALAAFGVALNGVALATTPHRRWRRVLYLMPVVWTALYWGRRGAIASGPPGRRRPCDRTA